MSLYYPRWQAQTVTHAMQTRRVLLLAGPRQSGKTTLVRKLVSKDIEYRTLDDQTLRLAAESDPQGFVKHTSRMLIIDEVQREPELLPAIKKVVDEDTRPGQFLLTGSANILALPAVSESLAGRVTKIRLRPLTQGEVLKAKPTFFDRAFREDFGKPIKDFDREYLLRAAFSGGFPEVLTLKPKERKSWHDDYIHSLLERDLKDIARVNRLEAMHELAAVLAAWSGKFIDIAAIGSGLSIRRRTIETYLAAIEALYLVERVRPWITTDYDRVGKQSKLFMTDCGLMASLLGWRMDQIKWDADRFGKLVETFAFNEIAAQVEVAAGVYRLFHYRDREKREIDFIIEHEDQRLLGIEVKAGSTVNKKDFKGLRWFRDNLAKDRSFVGVVLYSGEHVSSLGDHFWAVPFGCLWS